MLQRIGLDGLRVLVRQRLAEARAAGRHYIRDAEAFEAHLVDVAHSAEQVAERLQGLPQAERPDPLACFVAGAWHDGGKIWNGDDYHELTGALELLHFGRAWRLVRGRDASVSVVLRRAARAIVPHFALREQLAESYRPTGGSRDHVPALVHALQHALVLPAGTAADPGVLLPSSIDALVLIYCDMVPNVASVRPLEPGDGRLDERWRDVEAQAWQYDPALMPLLPLVRPRIDAACALIGGLLRDRDEPQLQSLRAFRNRFGQLPSSFPRRQ